MKKCKICHKEYASSQSLWNHNKNIHQKQVDDIYVCKYCNKEFKRKYNTQRHIKICKLNKKTINDNDIILKNTNDIIPKNKKQKLELFCKEFDLDEKSLMNLLVNKCKTNKHITNIGNQNIHIGNQNIQNIQNNTQINFNIIPLGNENLSEILTDKEQIRILNKKRECLEYILKYVHFNDKYPQFQNILVNDLKSNKALVYDESKKDFIVIKLDHLFDNLIENRVNDIGDFRLNQSESINQPTKKIIDNFLEKITSEYENPKSTYMKEKKGNMHIIMYNEKDKVKNTRKRLGKLKLKNK
jgi:hypothetical protein